MTERHYTAEDIERLTGKPVREWEYDSAWETFTKKYAHLFEKQRHLFYRAAHTKNPAKIAALRAEACAIGDQLDALPDNPETLYPCDEDGNVL